MKRALITFLICFGALAVDAQSEPDLIGSWKMDASRSSFSGPRGAPTDVVIRFERAERVLRETIKVVNAAGTSTRTINYAADGAETVNGTGEERVKAKLIRNANQIVLEWIDEGGTFTRALKLSNDRRTLSIKAHDRSSDSQTDDLIVLQRQ